ncbi:MAG: heme o synthase [Phycisphaeraceae bacterium]|nr:heme o synthase [Phycisphaeraceae bacterium]
MSRSSPVTASAVVAPGVGEARVIVRALLETTKPGITRLVTITSLVGFVAAAVGRPWLMGDLAWAFAGCLFGTYLSSAGANSLNMWWERSRDARMVRTSRRPLPRGSVRPSTVFWSGMLLCFAGLTVLMSMNGVAPAAVSLACIISYVLVYTPMKPVTCFSTLVGAIPGALPPLIGWAAASETGGFASLIEPGGLSLFGLMFVWQLPHFLAIAWMYKDDYALGGYRVLPVLDPTGAATSITMLFTAALLIPATLLPLVAMPRLGWIYGTVAVITGLVYLWLSLRLVVMRSRPAARRVFFASILHLPLLLGALVVDVWLA